MEKCLDLGLVERLRWQSELRTVEYETEVLREAAGIRRPPRYITVETTREDVREQEAVGRGG